MSKEELGEVLNKHKLWLECENGGKRADLIGADLRGANLSDADLGGVDISDADFSSAYLRNVSFRGADLRNVSFRGADLSGADLRGANLEGANLEGADIDHSCLPLWCGGLNFKVDKRIFCQLLYHLATLECDDKEVQNFQKLKSFRKLASQMHREDVDKSFLEVEDE